jgi:hypothetical protein
MTQANGKPEDPGALKLFSFREGQLTNLMSVAPNRGYGFGPRHEDVRGIYPRTFALDPSGRMLVATNNEPKLMRDGECLKTVPATIAAFRVGKDGRLSFANGYEAETRGDFQFWSGMVTLG